MDRGRVARCLRLPVLIDYSVKRWAAEVDILGGSLSGVERFETWFGVIFLIVILLSPGGLMGIWTFLTGRVERALARGPTSPDPAPVERSDETGRRCVERLMLRS